MERIVESFLWIKMNDYFLFFFSLISIIQLVGAVLFLVWIRKTDLFRHQNVTGKLLLFIAGLAFLGKFVLQGLSAIPALSVFFFNNMNLIIAYLHLILLMGISLFLVWKIVKLTDAKISKILEKTILMLIFGIVLNEMILVLAGVLSVFYMPFLYAYYGLLLCLKY